MLLRQVSSTCFKVVKIVRVVIMLLSLHLLKPVEGVFLLRWQQQQLSMGKSGLNLRHQNGEFELRNLPRLGVALFHLEVKARVI